MEPKTARETGAIVRVTEDVVGKKVVNYDRTRDVYVMKADKNLLKNAPGFDKNNWPDMSDPTRISEIYKYYGSEPY